MLKFRLTDASDRDSRICNAIEFQTSGQHTMKARLPIGVLVHGRTRLHLLDDLSKRVGAYGVNGDLRFAGRFSDRGL